MRFLKFSIPPVLIAHEEGQPHRQKRRAFVVLVLPQVGLVFQILPIQPDASHLPQLPGVGDVKRQHAAGLQRLARALQKALNAFLIRQIVHAVARAHNRVYPAGQKQRAHVLPNQPHRHSPCAHFVRGHAKHVLGQINPGNLISFLRQSHRQRAGSAAHVADFARPRTEVENPLLIPVRPGVVIEIIGKAIVNLRKVLIAHLDLCSQKFSGFSVSAVSAGLFSSSSSSSSSGRCRPLPTSAPSMRGFR